MALSQDDRDRLEDLQLDPTADRTEIVSATQRRLDAAADQAWERMQNCPRDHPLYEMNRDLAFSAKDRADTYAREKTMPPVHPAKNVTEGESNHHEGD